ncbi:MAG: hypothetical protein OES25_10230 [Acidobacteriota bacterium]|nr:hypothetical protein [Acidobacteriota bacterium]
MRHEESKLFLVLLALIAFCGVSNSGSLEPPGPPAPTMKNLSDVEPRIAIRNDYDTLTPVVISFSGSYYLAEDIYGFHGAHGIEIQVDDVTLDLNGFSIIGNIEVGSLDGISAGTLNNITVRNGRVRQFQRGVMINAGNGSIVENVQASLNGLIGGGGQGIQISNGVIRNCAAIGNAGTGIVAYGGVIENSAADGNGGDGLVVGDGVIRGSVSDNNGGHGISGSLGALIVNNVSSGNTGSGISSHGVSSVIGNLTTDNTGAEISAAGALILNNKTN